MHLQTLLGNSQRLDGGAMFGNAPRALWQRWATPDEHNRIALACRCLLVRDGESTILLETGIGAFFEPAMRERFGVVEPEHRLLGALAEVGVAPADIDLVVLSHLHFDHAGGLLSAWSPDAEPELLFPNARVLTSRAAWERACHPHPRDRASYIPALQPLLEASGRLLLAEQSTHPALPSGWRLHYSEGHTPGLLLTEVPAPMGPLVFAADLIPGAAWVHVPITMGYDRYPERLIDEKQRLLEDLEARGGWLCFTHDPEIAVGRVQRDARGRFGVVDHAASLG